ncbi:MAG: MFS transporter [Mycobacteriales bacterium]
MTREQRKLLTLSISGVFLDGYDITIISLALLQLKGQFHMGTFQLGFVASAILVGNFVGAIVFGRIADRVGRRATFILDIVFFIIFAVASAFSANYLELAVLRFFLGVGIGGDYALASPLVAETMPQQRRGRLLTLNWGLAWFLGEIVSFAVGLLLLNVAGADAWRWMLASGAIPAVVVLIGRRGISESPRWLHDQGRHGEADVVEQRLGTTVNWRPQAGAATGRSVRVGPQREIWGVFRRNTVFGMLNYVFEGAPFYALSVFLPTILKQAGLSKTNSGIAVGNLALQSAGIIGLLLIYVMVDRQGRRFVNYLGFGGVAAGLLAYIWIYPPSTPVLMALFAFILVAVWLGPASTDNLYLGELWPTRIRTTAAGICAGAGRLSAIAGTLGLPILIGDYGLRTAMWLLVVLCVLGVLNTALLGVETKGKSLEELWGL